jgi:hypothetical protein
MTFTHSGSEISLNDNGGCQGADDTLLLQQLDAYIGQNAYVKTITGAGVCLTTGVTLNYANLRAAAGSLVFQAAPAPITTEYLVRLAGLVDQTVDGVTFRLPAFNIANGFADPNLKTCLSIAAGAAAIHQVRITLRNVRTVGGEHGISIQNTVDFDGDHVLCEKAFRDGFVVSGSYPASRRFRLRNYRARNCGYYGMSIGGPLAPGLPHTEIDLDMIAEACGLFDPLDQFDKLGLDLVISNAQKLFVRLRAFNCGGGATEIKITGAGAYPQSPGRFVPAGIEDVNADVELITCLDQGSGLDIAYEAPPENLFPGYAGLEQAMKIRNRTTYRPAVPWQPFFNYERGDLVNCNGGVWMALNGALGEIDGVISATVVNGGSGYINDDVLTAFGGLASTPATFVVTQVGGVVSLLRPSTIPTYSTLPSNPVTLTGGHGTGCTANIVWLQDRGQSGAVTGVSSQADEQIVVSGGQGYVTGDTLTPVGGVGTAVPTFTAAATPTATGTGTLTSTATITGLSPNPLLTAGWAVGAPIAAAANGAVASFAGTTHTGAIIDGLSINPLTAGIVPGQSVTGAHIPSGALVTGVNSSSISISPFATGDGTGTIVVNLPPFDGCTTASSTALTPISINPTLTGGLAVGQSISGAKILAGTTISGWSTSAVDNTGTITLSKAPTVTGAGSIFAQFASFTGTTHSSKTIDGLGALNPTTGVAVGQTIAGAGVPAGTTIASVTASVISLSAPATGDGVGVALSSALAFTGTTSNAGTIVSGLQFTYPTSTKDPTVAGVIVGQGISGPGIPAGTSAKALSSTAITLSTATGTLSGSGAFAASPLIPPGSIILALTDTTATVSNPITTSTAGAVSLTVGGAVTSLAAAKSSASYSTPPPSPASFTTTGKGSGCTAIIGWAGPAAGASAAGGFTASFGVPNAEELDSVTAGGTGYNVNDILAVVGSTLGSSGTLVSAGNITTTNGSNVVSTTVNPISSGWLTGMSLAAKGVPPASYVTGLSSSNATISANATITGSGAAATVGQAQIQVVAQTSGAITAWEPYPPSLYGVCGYIALPTGTSGSPYDPLGTTNVKVTNTAAAGGTVSVAWGFPTYNDGSVVWGLRNNAFNRTAQYLRGMYLDSCFDMYFDLEATNVAYLVEFTPRGSNAMASANLSFINPRGWNITAAGFHFGSAQYPGYAGLDSIKIVSPDIHVTGINGIGLDLAGAWLNLTNFEIQGGGVIEATGATSYGFKIYSDSHSGSFSGRIGGDVQIRGTSNALYMASTSQAAGQDQVLSLTLSGATLENLGTGGGTCIYADGTSRTVPTGTGTTSSGGTIVNTTGNSAWLPGASISGMGIQAGATIASVGAGNLVMSETATSSGTITLTIGNLGSVSITADGPVNLRNPGAGDAGFSATHSAQVEGRFCRGFSASTPTVAGALGEYFLATAPTSALGGWICTTPGAAGVAVWTQRL